MMKLMIAFISGVLFGLGLIISGMANPSKVMSFLDITGLWDPSLAFVMLGATSVAFIGFYIAKRRKVTYLNLPIQLPIKNTLDKPLIIGSCLFGIGWGIAGICPGPGLVLLSIGKTEGFVFMLALSIGILIYQKIIMPIIP